MVILSKSTSLYSLLMSQRFEPKLSRVFSLFCNSVLWLFFFMSHTTVLFFLKPDSQASILCSSTQMSPEWHHCAFFLYPLALPPLRSCDDVITLTSTWKEHSLIYASKTFFFFFKEKPLWFPYMTAGEMTILFCEPGEAWRLWEKHWAVLMQV